MSTYDYDAGSVVANLANISLKGFAKGVFISAERNSDGFTMDVGSQGDVTRVQSQDRTGTVTITLQGMSPTNDLLSALALKDELFRTGKGPLLIKDTLGNDLISSPVAWIVKRPKIEKGNEASDREWKIACSVLTLNAGGAVNIT